jgi:hypothetical protein
MVRGTGARTTDSFARSGSEAGRTVCATKCRLARTGVGIMRDGLRKPSASIPRRIPYRRIPYTVGSLAGLLPVPSDPLPGYFLDPGSLTGLLPYTGLLPQSEQRPTRRSPDPPEPSCATLPTDAPGSPSTRLPCNSRASSRATHRRRNFDCPRSTCRLPLAPSYAQNGGPTLAA